MSAALSELFQFSVSWNHHVCQKGSQAMALLDFLPVQRREPQTLVSLLKRKKSPGKQQLCMGRYSFNKQEILYSNRSRKHIIHGSLKNSIQPWVPMIWHIAQWRTLSMIVNKCVWNDIGPERGGNMGEESRKIVHSHLILFVRGVESLLSLEVWSCFSPALLPGFWPVSLPLSWSKSDIEYISHCEHT